MTNFSSSLPDDIYMELYNLGQKLFPEVTKEGKPKARSNKTPFTKALQLIINIGLPLVKTDADKYQDLIEAVG